MSGNDHDYEHELNDLRSGSESVLAELFDTYRDRLQQIIRFRIDPRLTRRIDEEDILQETYVAASRRLKLYLASPDVSPFIWLRTMVNQTMIDLYRRHIGVAKRDAGREVSIDGFFTQATSASLAYQLVSDEPSPSGAVSRDELVDQVRGMIDEMEPIDREVLVMRHYEELTNNEIAEVLKVSAATASIRYVRAVERLKKIADQISGLKEFKPASTN